MPIIWNQSREALEAEIHFNDFKEAFAFMTEVAMVAEKMDHHPEWSNVWNKVQIKLRTHSAGNVVTEKDHALAAAIDAIYQKYHR